jgi:hypothetical protein
MPTEIKGVPEPTRRAPGAPAVKPHVQAPKPHIVRPGKYASGENQEGTPAGAEHTNARTNRYADGAAHRAGLRDSAK